MVVEVEVLDGEAAGAVVLEVEVVDEEALVDGAVVEEVLVDGVVVEVEEALLDGLVVEVEEVVVDGVVVGLEVEEVVEVDPAADADVAPTTTPEVTSVSSRAVLAVMAPKAFRPRRRGPRSPCPSSPPSPEPSASPPIKPRLKEKGLLLLVTSLPLFRQVQ